MATVSEVAFFAGEVGFCPCCGLRRPLGRLNVEFPDGDKEPRCADCFFGPPDSKYRFTGDAFYARRDNPLVIFGQTGDVLWDGHQHYFEPHGQGSKIAYFTVPVNIKTDLGQYNQYCPVDISRYMDFSDDDEDPL